MSSVTEIFAAKTADIQTQIDALIARQAKIASFEERVDNAVTKIGEVCGKVHTYFDAEGIRVSVSEEKDEVCVEVELRATAEFRFIPFNGYKKDGSSKNQKQRQAKASKLETLFKKATGTDHLSINQYSMEANKKTDATSDEGKRIVLTFWM